MTSPVMLAASFGGIVFDCISTSDSVNMVVIEHEKPRLDGASLKPMGAGARRTRLRCIFFEVPPEGDTSGLNYIERYELFHAKVTSGKTQTFVHPIFGSVRAKVVGDISYSSTSEELDSLMLECTFVEDRDESTLGFFRPTAISAGAAIVKVAADQLNSSLADAGLSSDVPNETSALVKAWASVESTTRRVNLELQSATNKIAKMTDDFELATNIERYPIWRSTQRLQGEMRKAAQSFQQKQPAVFSFTVVTDTPLLSLVAGMYGAEESSQRYNELMVLNDISDPLVIREGTVLKANSPDTANSRGLRSAL